MRKRKSKKSPPNTPVKTWKRVKKPKKTNDRDELVDTLSNQTTPTISPLNSPTADHSPSASMTSLALPSTSGTVPKSITQLTTTPSGPSTNQPVKTSPELTASSALPREPKPPLMHFKNVTSFTTFIKTIKDVIKEDTFTCKVKDNMISLQVSTSQQWRQVSTFAKTNNLEFYTHTLKEDKPFRVVVRNMHYSIPHDFIKADLAAKGHTVLNITNIKGRNNEPRSMFFIDLKPQDNNKDIFAAKYLCFCLVKVEEPYPQRNAVQCKRCQSPGHTKNWCNLPPQCVKCAGAHDTTECPHPKKVAPDTLKCVLCSGQGHAASWRGCPVHKKYTTKRTSNTKAPTPSLHSTQQQTSAPPPPLNNPIISYAATAAIKSQQANPQVNPSLSQNPSSPSIPTPYPYSQPTIPTLNPNPPIPSTLPQSPVPTPSTPHPTPIINLQNPSPSKTSTLPSHQQTPTINSTPPPFDQESLKTLTILITQFQQMLSPILTVLNKLATSLATFQLTS